MSKTNETKSIKWHETCKCICRLNEIICNNKQRWNKDKCRCECKQLIDKGVCDKVKNHQEDFIDSTEAATRGVLCKKLEISQNSQKNTCARVSFFIKLQVSGLQLYLKKDSDTGFSREFFKISKDTFFTEYILVTASDSTIFYRKD